MQGKVNAWTGIRLKKDIKSPISTLIMIQIKGEVITMTIMKMKEILKYHLMCSRVR